MRVRVTRTQTIVTMAAISAAVVFVVAIPGVRSTVSMWLSLLRTGDTEAATSAFREHLLGYGVWAPVVSGLLTVFQSVAAPIPSFVVIFTNGLLFGWGWGALLSWTSALVGASACFYIARFLGRPVVEKLVGGTRMLEVSDLFFERYGDRAVLIARLLTFVSFDLISYGAGLTNMTFRRFFLATAIGQIPAMLLYSYLGHKVNGSARVLFMVFAVTAVILLVASAARPLYVRRLRGRSGTDARGGGPAGPA